MDGSLQVVCMPQDCLLKKRPGILSFLVYNPAVVSSFPERDDSRVSGVYNKLISLRTRVSQVDPSAGQYCDRQTKVIIRYSPASQPFALPETAHLLKVRQLHCGHVVVATFEASTLA